MKELLFGFASLHYLGQHIPNRFKNHKSEFNLSMYNTFPSICFLRRSTRTPQPPSRPSSPPLRSETSRRRRRRGFPVTPRRAAHTLANQWHQSRINRASITHWTGGPRLTGRPPSEPISFSVLVLVHPPQPSPGSRLTLSPSSTILKWLPPTGHLHPAPPHLAAPESMHADVRETQPLRACRCTEL